MPTLIISQNTDKRRHEATCQMIQHIGITDHGADRVYWPTGLWKSGVFYISKWQINWKPTALAKDQPNPRITESSSFLVTRLKEARSFSMPQILETINGCEYYDDWLKVEVISVDLIRDEPELRTAEQNDSGEPNSGQPSSNALLEEPLACT